MGEEQYEEDYYEEEKPRRKKRVGRSIFYSLGFFFLLVKDAVVSDIRMIWHNARLFLGVGLLATGLLNFSSGKYCDGSVADHFSCTRPSTYYYYSEIMIAVAIVGAILILLWFLRRREA